MAFGQKKLLYLCQNVPPRPEAKNLAFSIELTILGDLRPYRRFRQTVIRSTHSTADHSMLSIRSLALTLVVSLLTLLIFLPAARAAVVIPGPYEGVITDAFDESQGAIVTANSPTWQNLPGSDPYNILGRVSETVEPSHTIFRDFAETGSVDFVEFALPAAVNLQGITLGLAEDGPPGNTWRVTTNFTLLASSTGLPGSYNVVSSIPLALDYFSAYGYGAITVSDTMNAPNVRYFRAEFTRGSGGGPRVFELDATATAATPEQSSFIVVGLMFASVAIFRKRVFKTLALAAPIV